MSGRTHTQRQDSASTVSRPVDFSDVSGEEITILGLGFPTEAPIMVGDNLARVSSSGARQPWRIRRPTSTRTRSCCPTLRTRRPTDSTDQSSCSFEHRAGTAQIPPPARWPAVAPGAPPKASSATKRHAPGRCQRRPSHHHPRTGPSLLKGPASTTMPRRACARDGPLGDPGRVGTVATLVPSPVAAHAAERKRRWFESAGSRTCRRRNALSCLDSKTTRAQSRQRGL